MIKIIFLYKSSNYTCIFFKLNLNLENREFNEIRYLEFNAFKILYDFFRHEIASTAMI